MMSVFVHANVVFDVADDVATDYQTLRGGHDIDRGISRSI